MCKFSHFNIEKCVKVKIKAYICGEIFIIIFFETMNIDRDIFNKLSNWKDKQFRKPLILMGARQVGKTWIMKEFGRRYFENTFYVNFDLESDVESFFVQTKNPEKILQSLSLYYNMSIEKGKTLVIFDEIQECNAALNSLKYFQETIPELHIVCAGSLLGVSLSRGDSFPVGKVDFMNVRPLSFKEFLAVENHNLVEYVNSIDEITEIPTAFFNSLKQQYWTYLSCGGMPEAMNIWFETKNPKLVDEKLKAILLAYQNDFAKHADNADIKRIQYVWDSIPSQLAKENRKFLFQLVKTGARAREYEDAIYWLSKAGLIQQIFLSEIPNLPLSAYKNLSAFKIYMNDTALLRVKSDLPNSVFVTENIAFKEFKGALAENYILQSLSVVYDSDLYYWKSDANAEVDFVFQRGLNVIPVEVKSGESITGKSLIVYDKKYSPSIKIRYSMRNLSYSGNLINIPLFLSDWTETLLQKCLDKEV